jgi:imidazolonepropionase-like amidohydrolase
MALFTSQRIGRARQSTYSNDKDAIMTHRLPMFAAATVMLIASLGLAGAALAAPTLVQNVRVFDGERMLARRAVLFDGATIVNADFHGKPPAGTTVVDGSGRTLLPGLIDAHVHAYQFFELAPLFGVTTEVDLFTGVSVVQDANKRIASGSNPEQADVFSSGTLATVPGGHGTEYGMPIPTLTTPGEAQAWVDARIAEGSHFVKIVVAPGRPGHVTPTLDIATVRALIVAAHQRGKLAVVHIDTLADARAVLEAGADGLAHLFVGTAISPAELAGFVALAKSRKAFVVPTFSVLESIAGLTEDDVLGDASLTALLSKAELPALKGSYGSKPNPALLVAPKAVTKALQLAGVPVLAGTDAGNTGTQYGISLHHEMAALVQAGLTPLQALTAATSAPASAFRLGKRGRIAKGYKADLLLVEGEPDRDIAATRRIVAVWKDGIDAAPLRAAQLARVAAEREATKAVAKGLALPADGRISGFTKDRLGSPVGMGWLPSDDHFLGGKSSVTLSASEGKGGADAALAVTATVTSGFAYPWAGVVFMPGNAPMAPANLSGANTLRFKVRGDGGSYNVAVLAAGTQIPVNQAFSAGKEWREVRMALADFKGIDTAAITMIGFHAGPVPGTYAFELADVRLLNE